MIGAPRHPRVTLTVVGDVGSPVYRRAPTASLRPDMTSGRPPGMDAFPSVGAVIVAAMSDEPTVQQILSDPVGWGYSEAEAERLRNDLVIGQAAQLLLDRELPSAAALMRDVQVLEFEYIDNGSSYGWMDSPPAEVNAYLDVAPFIRRRFTDERLEEISGALNAAKSRENLIVERVIVRDVLPNVGVDWRDQFDKNLTAERPTNQALRS